jgi:uncharacterized membrane protein YtjA (UPF0391 family)
LFQNVGRKELPRSSGVDHEILSENGIMLGLVITLLIIALIAAALGFGGIAGAAAGIAKLVFFVFIVLFLLSLIFGGSRGFGRRL